MTKELNELFNELLIIEGLDKSKIKKYRRILKNNLNPRVLQHLVNIVLFIIEQTEPRFYFEIRNTVNLFNNFMSKFIKSTMIKNKNFLNRINFINRKSCYD